MQYATYLQTLNGDNRGLKAEAQAASTNQNMQLAWTELQDLNFHYLQIAPMSSALTMANSSILPNILQD